MRTGGQIGGRNGALAEGARMGIGGVLARLRVRQILYSMLNSRRDRGPQPMHPRNMTEGKTGSVSSASIIFKHLMAAGCWLLHRLLEQSQLCDCWLFRDAVMCT